MVETRSKRKLQGNADPPKPPPKKLNSKQEKAAPTASKKDEKGVQTKTGGPPSVGDVITLEGFGGEIKNHEGEAVTLKSLVEASTAGVVLFTYPKASTPGCKCSCGSIFYPCSPLKPGTRQACLFRDKKDAVNSSKGLTIYGLSADSAAANTNFKTKQSLNYELLCDTGRSLIGAIGLKEGDKTKRGVFVVDKKGKVLLSKKGGPEETVRWVEELEMD
jgi:thioredoxin-dependent peroxiredoxin